MVHKIAKILSLPGIKHIVRIEDIATKEEMQKAQFHRLKEGKHIIPVPTIELKPHFSGYLIDPLQTFLKKTSSKRRRLGEKSIVRPIFSYYGKLIIDDSAVAAIVKRTVLNGNAACTAEHISVKRIRENDEERGVAITLDVIMYYGVDLLPAAEKLQSAIAEQIESMTGMIVNEVNIKISSLRLRQK
jgi:uncharacterized alkaline shock family protein YloU